MNISKKLSTCVKNGTIEESEVGKFVEVFHLLLGNGCKCSYAFKTNAVALQLQSLFYAFSSHRDFIHDVLTFVFLGKSCSSCLSEHLGALRGTLSPQLRHLSLHCRLS